jgi:ribonucleotide monophosphatase NagD (HAD superfamily)
VDDVRAVLLDIDGVLTVSWEPLDGAVEAVQTLRDAGLPLVLVTNTSSRTRARIAELLADAGFRSTPTPCSPRPPPRPRTCASTVPGPAACC